MGSILNAAYDFSIRTEIQVAAAERERETERERERESVWKGGIGRVHAVCF